jgi:hypothetical protein
MAGVAFMVVVFLISLSGVGVEERFLDVSQPRLSLAGKRLQKTPFTLPSPWSTISKICTDFVDFCILLSNLGLI